MDTEPVARNTTGRALLTVHSPSSVPSTIHPDEIVSLSSDSLPPHPDSVEGLGVSMSEVLSNFQPDLDAIKALFHGEEDQTDRLCGLLLASSVSPEHRTVIYLSYENPWGESGGIRAVANMLPEELERAGEPVVRVSPLHRQLKLKDALSKVSKIVDVESSSEHSLPAPLEFEQDAQGRVSTIQWLARCPVTFAGTLYPTDIYQALGRDGRQWILFGNESFFNADGGSGRSDCYVYSGESREHRDGENSCLLRDSLFCVKALPEVVRALNGLNLTLKGLPGPLPLKDLLFHGQDWECAALELTVKDALLAGKLESAAVRITLHNPYDHGLSVRNLSWISSRCQDHHWPMVKVDQNQQICRGTVLSRMLPIGIAPVSSVSKVIASECLRRPEITSVFTGHLTGILKNRIGGIDNGIFDPIHELTAQERQAYAQAKQGRPAALLQDKLRKRHHMLPLLEEFLALKKNECFGSLDGGRGKALSDLDDNVPIFLAVGRLDPGQKGFDTIVRAIEQLPVGAGRYIISPLSPLADTHEIRPFMDDMARVAERRAGEVVLLPFRIAGSGKFQDIYNVVRQGVSWSPWASVYEPFGGVTEFYVNGTPVVANAVGGLIQQVISYDLDPKAATGFLYRAPSLFSPQQESYESRQIHDTCHPEGRMAFPVYRNRVSALTRAMLQAILLYRNCPEEYGTILSNLPDMAAKLSWAGPVADYRAWYGT